MHLGMDELGTDTALAAAPVSRRYPKNNVSWEDLSHFSQGLYLPVLLCSHCTSWIICLDIHNPFFSHHAYSLALFALASVKMLSKLKSFMRPPGLVPATGKSVDEGSRVNCEGGRKSAQDGTMENRGSRVLTC